MEISITFLLPQKKMQRLFSKNIAGKLTNEDKSLYENSYKKHGNDYSFALQKIEEKVKTSPNNSRFYFTCPFFYKNH